MIRELVNVGETNQRRELETSWAKKLGQGWGKGIELQHVFKYGVKIELQQGPGNSEGAQGSQLIWRWQRRSPLISVTIGTESTSHHSFPAIEFL